MWNLRNALTLILALTGTGISATSRPSGALVSVQDDLAVQDDAVTDATHALRQLEARSSSGVSGAGTSDLRGKGAASRKGSNSGKASTNKKSTSKRVSSYGSNVFSKAKTDVKAKDGEAARTLLELATKAPSLRSPSRNSSKGGHVSTGAVDSNLMSLIPFQSTRGYFPVVPPTPSHPPVALQSPRLPSQHGVPSFRFPASSQP